MDSEQFKNQADQIQSSIFSVKLSQLRVKESIEKEKLTGLNIKLEAQKVKTSIDRETLGMTQDELKTVSAKRQLRQQKHAIELDGLSRELPLMRESVEIRLNALRAKNVKSILGGDD